MDHVPQGSTLKHQNTKWNHHLGIHETCIDPVIPYLSRASQEKKNKALLDNPYQWPLKWVPVLFSPLYWS